MCTYVGVKGHLEVIWGYCSNMLKMLLCLHNLIDFDETWVKRSLAWSSFRVFRNFFIGVVILGSFGVTVERSNFKEPSTSKQTMSMCWSRSTVKKCLWWPLHPTWGQGVKGQESSNLVLWGVKCWITWRGICPFWHVFF